MDIDIQLNYLTVERIEKKTPRIARAGTETEFQESYLCMYSIVSVVLIPKKLQAV
jgi:hypothetical protein